jgi:hypothetical protein
MAHRRQGTAISCFRAPVNKNRVVMNIEQSVFIITINLSFTVRYRT